ncbi:tRNA (adenosine(37)-N6)-dimethylallyltransferase MiaA [Tellurirhabdus rosea]|uniref:tRNA (adenosine(37)-N6)-dimethylallyltransferase MiaA n=1 Tax=Tellurirhabdus rosea TaxID=2674997 RepID=UPI002259BC3F|nr:tRNA (adenosine(37)-N6)-dimethylallyltransferase MiaA [Tellurirhabdus rosea]
MIIILGPTASGKTRLAVQLAHRLNGEIISADSRQVYRDMDIGTGKDLDEYRVGDAPVPYHLINIVDAGTEYNLYEFQKDFHAALANIQQRKKLPVVCGGTGLYLEAVLKGHQFTAIPIDEAARRALESLPDEELHRIFRETPSAYTPLADTSTRKRLIRAIEISRHLQQHPDAATATTPELTDFLVVGLNPPVELRRERISRRLHERLRNGMIEEVETLLKRGIPAERLIYYGLEYKFITQYLTGDLDYDTLSSRLETAIHQFAKRQMTYFRKMERDGLPIHWLDGTRPTPELCEDVVRLYRTRGL